MVNAYMHFSPAFLYKNREKLINIRKYVADAGNVCYNTGIHAKRHSESLYAIAQR